MKLTNKNTAKKPATKPLSTRTKDTVPYSRLSCDLKDSLLIVSVAANVFILTAWIALQVTTQFDAQVSSFLFNR